MKEFKDLAGQSITKVEIEDEAIVLHLKGGGKCSLYHMEDCCELVHVDHVIGDWSKIIGRVITDAKEEHIGNDTPPNFPGIDHLDSYTWSNYEIRAPNANVIIRWYGSSNGYYCEVPHVTFEEGEKKC